MAGFLYYLKGKDTAVASGGLPPAELVAAGLGHVAARPYSAYPVARGPAGDQPGAVVCDPHHPRPGYHPEAQHWQATHLPSVWLGWLRASPPDPQDLVRDRITPRRHAVQLGDGKRWLIPVALAAPETQGGAPVPSLPTLARLDAQGAWTFETAPDYVALWEAVRMLIGGAGPDGVVTPKDELELCTVAMAANYSVTRLEVAALGLLDTGSVQAIAEALLDKPGFDDLRKKAGSAGANSGPGPADAIPATGPA